MRETMKAGRDLDVLVAEKVMGVSLAVPRERAMAMLGVSYIIATGPTFDVQVGEHRLRVPMPNGETLGGWEGDDNYNWRYFRYVVAHLLEFPNKIGEKVARDLASIRDTPKPYSKDLAAAWTVIDAMMDRCGAFGFRLGQTHESLPTCDFWFDDSSDFGREGTTMPHAICLAALAAVESRRHPDTDREGA